MLRLLSIEIHKLKHNRASKILIFTYFGLLSSIALISAIKFKIGTFEFNLANEGIFNFPYIWHFNTYVSSIFKFFLLLVIVSMTANEYSYKTIKQNLIDGLSKKEFVLSKFYTVTALAFLSTVFVFMVSLILGYLHSDFKELSIVFSDLEYLVAFFIKLTGFFSFGLFLGILIKRSAFAIGAMVIWSIIENAIKGFLHFKYATYENIANFLPLEAMSNLIKQPFTRLSAVKNVAKQVGENVANSHSVQLLDMVIVLAWTAIFVYLSYALLKRRDL
ncbi:MAG: ABC transporter permease subunit [Flavobacteriaceae bacterium]|nr:ABC transporter permease subunit [Flavobacteriaceae bacterium]